MKNLKDLMNALNIPQYPKRWNNLFNHSIEENANCIVERNFIQNLHNKYRLFKCTLDEVLYASDKIREKPELMQYIYLLNLAMKDREVFGQEFDKVNPPKAIEGEDTTPYDFALLFAVLPTVPDMANSVFKRGVPQDVCYATFAGYEDAMLVYKSRTGKLGFGLEHFFWIQLYIDAIILRIGRLNFEMCSRFGAGVKVYKNISGDICILAINVRIHRDGLLLGIPGYEDEEDAFDADIIETDDYFEGYPIEENGRVKNKRIQLNKNLWHIVLSPDDPVILVHIPADGSLSEKLCENAYSRAYEIFASCYPEFKYKAFACFSWLMDPQLATFLPSDSNIIKFQNKYISFPNPCSGKSILRFVFLNRYDSYENLPENTSLERSLKKHYLNGKYIYELGGIFFNKKI